MGEQCGVEAGQEVEDVAGDGRHRVLDGLGFGVFGTCGEAEGLIPRQKVDHGCQFHGVVHCLERSCWGTAGCGGRVQDGADVAAEGPQPVAAVLLHLGVWLSQPAGDHPVGGVPWASEQVDRLITPLPAAAVGERDAGVAFLSGGRW